MHRIYYNQETKKFELHEECDSQLYIVANYNVDVLDVVKTECFDDIFYDDGRYFIPIDEIVVGETVYLDKKLPKGVAIMFTMTWQLTAA